MKKSPYYRPRKTGRGRKELIERFSGRRRGYPDLQSLAGRAMKARGFLIDLPKPGIWQVHKLQEPKFNDPGIRDLTAWLWSSIDNDDSRDLDQVECAREEHDGIRIHVGVADVDHFVPHRTALDHIARHNTTSIYTGVINYPMLPDRLSTDLSSLNTDGPRLAVVFEMLVRSDGSVRDTRVFRAVVQNKAQLTYDATGRWLDGTDVRAEEEGAITEAGSRTLARIRQDPELQTQLRLQDRAAAALRRKRHDSGALSLETREVIPVLEASGRVIDLRERHQNSAGLLIEDLMVAANGVAAGFLDHHHVPSIRRVVRTPDRWPRIVEVAAALGHALPPEPDSRSLEEFLRTERESSPKTFPELSLTIVKLLGRGEYLLKRPGEAAIGHFGLAVRHYSHSTAPNRRYPDLVTQRLIKASLAGEPIPYPPAELHRIATHCTEREDAANKVERFVRKCAAAALLMSRIGEVFEAVVSGINQDGTWVRLIHPPAEGKLARAERLDIGEPLRVRLVSVNPEKGFIDFETA